MIIAGILTSFDTQALFSTRPNLENKIDDALHEWTAAVNEFLHENLYWSTALLIVSAAIVDFSAVFLLDRFIFGLTLRPFLPMLVLFLTRHICQALIALPSPSGMIWYHSGFPSLFVTYYVTSDLFFLGHTGIAVLAALELFRMNSRIGILLVVLEISAIIVLRAHYTMDIFDRVIMAWLASILADWTVHKQFKFEKNV